MMTITQRAASWAPQTLGRFDITRRSAAAPALATGADDQDAATSLFFREKAFWQFRRGARLGDLRRLIRQYGRTEDNVFHLAVSGAPRRRSMVRRQSSGDGQRETESEFRWLSRSEGVRSSRAKREGSFVERK